MANDFFNFINQDTGLGEEEETTWRDPVTGSTYPRSDIAAGVGSYTNIKMFSDLIKDATSNSGHVVTAIGNSQARRRREFSMMEAEENADLHGLAADGADPEQSSRDFKQKDQWDSDIIKHWSLPFKILKSDGEKQHIYGWASVVYKDGKVVVDKQGDIIPIEELENAVVDYMLTSRVGRDMHKGDAKSRLIFSAINTPELQHAFPEMFKQSDTIGWVAGFKIDDPELWDMIKSGERPEFSIGGAAVSLNLGEDFSVSKARGRRLARAPFR
jgi:hypothetical protein